MPSFAGDDDRTLQNVIERWRATAKDEVGNIEMFRADPRGLPATSINRFSAHTSYLVATIPNSYPQVNPEPIWAVYEAVRAWHEDPRGVPPTEQIYGTLEKANALLCVLDAGIRQRTTEGEKATTPRGGRSSKRPAGGGRPKVDAEEADRRWAFYNTVEERRREDYATLEMVAEDEGVTMKKARAIMYWCQRHKTPPS